LSRINSCRGRIPTTCWRNLQMLLTGDVTGILTNICRKLQTD
jgi:hypothetical protein